MLDGIIIDDPRSSVDNKNVASNRFKYTIDNRVNMMRKQIQLAKELLSKKTKAMLLSKGEIQETTTDKRIREQRDNHREPEEDSRDTIRKEVTVAVDSV